MRMLQHYFPVKLQKLFMDYDASLWLSIEAEYIMSKIAFFLDELFLQDFTSTICMCDFESHIFTHRFTLKSDFLQHYSHFTQLIILSLFNLMTVCAFAFDTQEHPFSTDNFSNLLCDCWMTCSREKSGRISRWQAFMSPTPLERQRERERERQFCSTGFIPVSETPQSKTGDSKSC